MRFLPGLQAGSLSPGAAMALVATEGAGMALDPCSREPAKVACLRRELTVLEGG